MARYVALLRGINLGSRNKIAMPALRGVFEGLGHEDVKTYIQSGNVVFTADAKDPTRLAAEIEERVRGDLGVTASVLLRTGDELDAVVAANPFVGRKADASKLHVTFLTVAPAKDQVAELGRPPGEAAEMSLVGREVFLYCPEGYGCTKLNNAFIEKRLGVAATTRNWKTVTTLAAMAGP